MFYFKMDRDVFIQEFLTELLNDPSIEEYHITPQTNIKTIRRFIKQATSCYIPVRLKRLDGECIKLDINIEGSVADIWKSIGQYYRERGVTLSLRYLKRKFDIQFESRILEPRHKLKEYSIQPDDMLTFSKRIQKKSRAYMRRG